MKRLFKPLLASLCVPAAIALTVMAPTIVRAAVVCVDGNVCPGYDLFETAAGTSFDGISFRGVPLGTYNFGGTIGVQNTGAADTIIERMSTVAAPSGTTDLSMLALQLVSTSQQFVPGLGTGFLYVTLDKTLEATVNNTSANTMTISIPSPTGGTFSSSLDVFFDVTFGSPSGPNVDAGLGAACNLQSDGSCEAQLSSSGALWSHTAPGDLVVPSIDGVNYLLDGVDTSGDFWPGVITERHSFAVHVVTDTPEPGTLVLLGSALFGFGLLRRRSPR